MMTTPGSGAKSSGFAGPAVTPASSLRGETLGQVLSRREMQCLVSFARTGSRKEAARELGLKVFTVRGYLATAYAKLGVHNAYEAYRALGWLHVPEVAA